MFNHFIIRALNLRGHGNNKQSPTLDNEIKPRGQYNSGVLGELSSLKFGFTKEEKKKKAKEHVT